MCSPLTWWLKVLHLPMLLPLVVVSAGPGALFSVISDSVRYFEISFSMSPGHVEKYSSLIDWSRVSLVGQKRI